MIAIDVGHGLAIKASCDAETVVETAPSSCFTAPASVSEVAEAPAARRKKNVSPAGIVSVVSTFVPFLAQRVVPRLEYQKYCVQEAVSVFQRQI